MVLTIEEVRRIAILARLKLTPEEEATFVLQLGRIVEYIDQLERYDTVDQPPAELPAAEAADLPAACLPWEVVERNAPETFAEFVVVPQVKGDDD